MHGKTRKEKRRVEGRKRKTHIPLHQHPCILIVEEMPVPKDRPAEDLLRDLVDGVGIPRLVRRGRVSDIHPAELDEVIGIVVREAGKQEAAPTRTTNLARRASLSSLALKRFSFSLSGANSFLIHETAFRLPNKRFFLHMEKMRGKEKKSTEEGKGKSFGKLRRRRRRREIE